MKKKFLSLALSVIFGASAFASSSSTAISNFIKINDVKFAKGTCLIRITYTNPNTGQSTSWYESYQTATAEECGKLLNKRIQELSLSSNVN